MFKVFLCVVVPSALATACASPHSSRPDWSMLHKQCVQPGTFLSQGGLVYAGFEFNADCDARWLAKQIRQGLEMGLESDRWPYDDMMLPSPPITELEYWALALADLTGTEYKVHIFETDAERRERLRQFLASIDLP